MLNKRVIFILLLFVIAIGVLSSASASDLSDMVGNATSDEIGIDDSNEGNVEILESKSSDNILESADDGTFTALQNKIDNADEGSEISLENDYYYNSDFGSNDGVKITKSLTINGNGHKIDGLSKSALFQANGVQNIVLNNITFQKGVYNQDGQVIGIINVSHFKLNACNFNENYGVVGGAIKIRHVNSSSISGCCFTNNKGSNNGGAIHMSYVNESLISECIFDNNENEYFGGAILLENMASSMVVGCSFTNNKATVYYGGAVYSSRINNLSFVKCNFTGNSAYDGGAIISYMIDHYYIDSCNFTDNYADVAGGAIYLYCVSDFHLTSCNAIDNVVSLYGGFIYCDESSCNLKNSNISRSASYSFGGAIASIQSDIDVDNCNFNVYGSMTDSGGAIYSFQGNLTICDSSFIQGRAVYGGAIASLKSNTTISSSEFIENTARFGGSVYTNQGNFNVSDSIFNGSRADLGSAINCMMSASLAFTNNVFLNSSSYYGMFADFTVEKPPSIIAINCPSDDITDIGNHHEEVYHICLAYTGYLNGEEITANLVLNYVLSNDETFFNTPETVACVDFKRLGLENSRYLNSSTIFGNYDYTFAYTINFTECFGFEEEFKIESFSHKVYDDHYNFLFGVIDEFSQTDDGLTVSFEDNMLSFDDNPFHNDGFIFNEVFLINSTSSDSQALPSYYDSRDYGYITPVKNQGNAGNCWAFAGLATLEACIKKVSNVTYDFSEENAKNLMAMYSIYGIDLKPNRGGYESMIMGYLTSWLGPISEENDEYDPYSALSKNSFPMYYIQNIKFLPARKSTSDNDLIKKAIMDYGAVAVSFYWTGNGYHAITLVGWDDNYNDDDSLGTNTKGAWIFKNSWGANWGDNGFGYLSYRYAFLSDVYDFSHPYTFVFNKNDGYLRNYQYDSVGATDYICSEGHVYYANKFKANNYLDEEFLTAFSTYFRHPTDYKVSVYKNGALVLSQKGYSDAGYYTIPFNERIVLYSGDEFTIMVENCNDGENCLPVSQADEVTMGNFKANTSFVSYDGINWFDLSNLEDYTEFLYGGVKQNTCQVACIKAFTSMDKLYEPFYSIEVSEFDNVDLNKEITINITLKDPIFIPGTQRVEGSLITININGTDYYAQVHNNKAFLTVSFDKAGKYVLSAQRKTNVYETNTVQFTFTVNKINTVISASKVSKTYGGSENSVVTLKDVKGAPVEDAVVIFNINGKPTKFITNAKGQVNVPVSLAPKTYTATVSFAGEGNYDGATTKVTIVVKKAASKITAKNIKLNVKKSKKYSVTLKDSKGKAIKKAKLTLKVNGKTFKATTNSKGKATFNLKLSKKGNFKATIKFAGNTYYKASSKKVKVAVKK